MGKSYSEKVKNRSEKRSGSVRSSKKEESPPFPLAPFVVLGLVVVLIIAGVVMYSMDRSEDDDGGTDIVEEDQGNEDPVNDDPSASGRGSILLDTTEGSQIFLDQYSGKVVVIDMFATWCSPCKVQMGELEDLRSRFEPSELVILSVGADLSESMDLLSDFKEQEGADWTFARSNREFNSEFPARSIPTMYVIDPEGNTAEKYVGVTEADVLESEARSLL